MPFGMLHLKSGKSTERFEGSTMTKESYEFSAQIPDIEKFIIGSRPYRTNIWRKVPLPKSIVQLEKSNR